MVEYGPPVLALIVGSVIAALDLVSTKYPRTRSFLASSRSLIYYSLLYGIISVVVMLALDAYVTAQVVSLPGVDLDNPWLTAISVGLAVKAFLTINIYTVRTGPGEEDKMPIGLSTITKLIEGLFLFDIDVHESNAVRKHVQTRLGTYNALADVKKTIKGNLPNFYSDQANVAYAVDVDNFSSIKDALASYLRYVEIRMFDSVFPV